MRSLRDEFSVAAGSRLEPKAGSYFGHRCYRLDRRVSKGFTLGTSRASSLAKKGAFMRLLGVLVVALLAVPAAAQPLNRVQVRQRSGARLLVPGGDCPVGHQGLQDGRRARDRDLQLLPLRPLPPRLSKRARRNLGVEADQRLWLVVVRRRTHGAGRALGGGGLPMALPGLERSGTHDGRGLLRRPVALPGHVPQVLCLDARSAGAGRPDDRGPRGHPGESGLGHRGVCRRLGPQSVLSGGQSL